MSDHRYGAIVRWSDEDGEFVATVPEFPAVSALGATREEALQELEAALSLVIDDMAEDGATLPEPQTVPSHSGQLRIRIPRSLHARLADLAELEGVSQNTLIISLLERGFSDRFASAAAGPQSAGQRRAS